MCLAGYLPHDAGWEVEVEEIMGFSIDEQHVQDAQNSTHPPFFDAAQQYEMLVFRGLTHTTLQLGSFQIESSPIVFFVAGNVLLSAYNPQNRFSLVTRALVTVAPARCAPDHRRRYFVSVADVAD
ncbi:MAG: hypothetical protein L3K52_06770 [Candidatus Thiothrix sulfatifontis]|nr:MAG: hypothetical protein L3K52_06770 [Candidatus Thiothrix sulfatifontis]